MNAALPSSGCLRPFDSAADHLLPAIAAIAANSRAMRDLKRLLRKYRLETGDAPTIPVLVGAGT